MKISSKPDTADGKPKRKSAGLGGLINVVGTGLAIASIIQELRKPPRKRSWHGELFGRVPYDWRLPTAKRIRRALWQPRSRHLVQPTVFGVGWTLNFAAMLRPLKRVI